MILSDLSILKRCHEEGLMSPFFDTLVRQDGNRKVVSYGLSSYGYDVRIKGDVLVRLKRHETTQDLDPKRPAIQLWEEVGLHTDDQGGRYFVMHPNDYVLGHTAEVFDMPRDLLALCVGKSTYARLGVLVNVTPIEPGFKGDVVIELSNPTSQHVRVYVDEGIAQFMFFQGDHPCEISYGDRGGKYQGQRGITHATV